MQKDKIDKINKPQVDENQLTPAELDHVTGGYSNPRYPLYHQRPVRFYDLTPPTEADKQSSTVLDQTDSTGK